MDQLKHIIQHQDFLHPMEFGITLLLAALAETYVYLEMVLRYIAELTLLITQQSIHLIHYWLVLDILDHN